MKIEGFFSGIKTANEVVEKLKSQGFSAYSDLNDHYQVNREVNTKDLSFLSTSSNADLVLNDGTPSGSTDRSPLLAASPMVSGMGGFEEVADINYKVIVNVDSNNQDKAKQIIESLGGSTRDPNVNIPTHIKDIDLGNADIDLLK